MIRADNGLKEAAWRQFHSSGKQCSPSPSSSPLHRPSPPTINNKSGGDKLYPHIVLCGVLFSVHGSMDAGPKQTFRLDEFGGTMPIL